MPGKDGFLVGETAFPFFWLSAYPTLPQKGYSMVTYATAKPTKADGADPKTF